MEYRADLHCHSTCSDGTMTPIELLHLAKKKGLSGLSITDHDTLDAYTPETFQAAKELGIDLFVGVEFSARYHNSSVHILGYNVEKNETILSFCEKHKIRRENRNREILEKFKKYSIFITEEELFACATGSVIGRPHIAQILVQKNYVKDIQEAFDRYLGERKCCFVESHSFTIPETIDVIHEAHGKALIAHPHLIQRQGILRILIGMNFDGIECYYSNLHNQIERKWLKMAKEKNWLMSGGSDFHGSIKPYIELGASWVDKETVDRLFKTP